MVADARNPAPPGPLRKATKMFVAGQRSSGHWWIFEDDRRTLVGDDTALYAVANGAPTLGALSDEEFGRFIEDRDKYQ